MVKIRQEEHHTMLHIEHLGQSLSFTLQGIPEDKHKWLGEVIDRQFVDSLERVRIKAIVEQQELLRRAIGIKITTGYGQELMTNNPPEITRQSSNNAKNNLQTTDVIDV